VEMHHSVKCLTIEVDTGLLLHIMKSFFVYECQRLTKLRKKISITFWAASTAQCSQCTVDIIRPNRRSGSFLFGTPATCAQTEKAIKIPSIGGRATRVGPKEQCIRWNPRSPCGYDNFEGTYAKHPKLTCPVFASAGRNYYTAATSHNRYASCRDHYYGHFL